MIEVRVDGLPELEATFRRVEAAVTRGPEPAVWRDLLADLRTYPPPPPGSRYQRTGRLAAGWRTGFSQGRGVGTLFKATNATPYGEYVQGDESQQARIHRNRWTPAGRILERYTQRIIRDWESEIDRAAGG